MTGIYSIIEEYLVWDIESEMMARSPKNMSTGVSPINFRVGKYFRPSTIRTHTFHNTKIVDGHVALPNNLKYGKMFF